MTTTKNSGWGRLQEQRLPGARDSAAEASSGPRLGVAAFLCALGLLSCSAPPADEIQVKVRGVEIDRSARPVVLLEDESQQLGLPIWIGPAEAQAITMELEGIAPERPLTHDLFKNTLEAVGVQLEKIVIADLRNSTYYARLHLTASGERKEVDARPSDAIALALRFRRPVYVASSLFRGPSVIDLRALGAERRVEREAGLTVQDVTPELAEHFDLAPGEGVIVADIAAGAAQGLRRGDIILAIDGEAVGSARDFGRQLRQRDSALPVRLSVLRDGERIPVEFVVSRR